MGKVGPADDGDATGAFTGDATGTVGGAGVIGI
jgi:hypothetical protein